MESFLGIAVICIRRHLILRLGGRKSISQMTIPQLAIIISLGAILGGEVTGKGVFQSIVATVTFVGFLMVTVWITLHWNGAEKALKGQAIHIISEGKLMVKNLDYQLMTWKSVYEWLA